MIVRNFLSGVEEKPKSTIYVTGLNSTDTVYATSPSGKRVNAVLGRKKNPDWIELPSGYKQLKYIGSTGTQRIQLGVSDYPFSFKGVIQPTEVTTDSRAGVLGEENGSTGYGIVFTNNSGLQLLWQSTWTRVYDYTLNEIIEIDVTQKDGEQHANINGVLTNTTLKGNPSTTHKLALFAHNLANNWHYSKFNLYGECHITVGTSEFDFIPVMDMSNNRIGLYDFVSNTFFGNSGTGSFIAGPEVPEYIDCFILEVSELGNFVITTPTTTQNVLVDEVGEYYVEF